MAKSQVTFSMSQCNTCHVTDGCAVREKLLDTLSTTSNALNITNAPGSGAAVEIIVICKRVIVG